MSIKRYKDFTGKDTSAPLMEKYEYFKHIDSIQLHIDAMIIENKSIDEINESFSDILNTLGGGFKQTLYQYAAEWLLEKMGIPTKDADGKTNIFVKIATQIVSKIDFMHINNYFGSGSCKYWTQAIQEGLIGFCDLQLVNLISGYLHMPEEGQGGVGRTLATTLANSITVGLQSTEFVTGLEKSINGKICGEGAPGFSDIFKGKKIDPEKSKIWQMICTKQLRKIQI